MTLPDERTRAILWGLEFLYDLMDPKKTPKVPREIRRRAASVARHYPGPHYLKDFTDANFSPLSQQEIESFYERLDWRKAKTRD